MRQLRIGTVHASIPVIDQPIAIVDIVVGHTELLLIKPTEFEKAAAWSEETSGSDRGIITRHRGIGEIPMFRSGHQFESWTGEPMIESLHHPGMLNATVGED